MNIIELANQAATQSETFVHHGFDGAFLERFAALVIAEHVKGVDMEPVAWINEDQTIGPELGKKRLSFDKYHSLNPLRYKHTPLYTAEQMAAQRHKALDEAAEVCDGMGGLDALGGEEVGSAAMVRVADKQADLCAAAIRALKGE